MVGAVERLARKDQRLVLQVGKGDAVRPCQPMIARNGEDVIINQVGWSGINLGRIDYELQRGARPVRAVGARVLPVGATC